MHQHGWPDRATCPVGHRAGEAEDGGDGEEAGFDKERLRHGQAEPDLDRVPEHEGGDGKAGADPTLSATQSDPENKLLGQRGHKDRQCCYR